MELTILNTNFDVVHIVESGESLVWTERFDACGDFEFYAPVDLKTISMLQEDYYIRIPDSEHVMIIETRSLSSDIQGGDKFLIKGRSLSSILDRRIIFARTVIDDTMQDAIEDILMDNVINSIGQPQRNIPGFIFSASSDPLVTTPTLQAQYDGDQVYTTIKNLCQRTNIGFKVVLNSSNQFVFSLYAGEDRSYTQSTNPFVIFSYEFDNLKSSEYRRTKMLYKTIGFLKGDAYNFPPDNRPVADFDPWENDPSDPHYPTVRTGLARREIFIDDPGLNLIDPLTDLPFPGGPSGQGTWIMYERIRQVLNENGIFDTFDADADSSIGFKYGTDFFLGDIVQIEDKYGTQARARVVEVIRSEDKSGIKVLPTFRII